MKNFSKLMTICLLMLGSLSFAQGRPLLKCDLVDYPIGHVSQAGIVVSVMSSTLLTAGQAPIANDDPTKFWVTDVNGSPATSIYNITRNTRSFGIFNGYFPLDYANCIGL